MQSGKADNTPSRTGHGCPRPGISGATPRTPRHSTHDSYDQNANSPHGTCLIFFFSGQGILGEKTGSIAAATSIARLSRQLILVSYKGLLQDPPHRRGGTKTQNTVARINNKYEIEAQTRTHIRQHNFKYVCMSMYVCVYVCMYVCMNVGAPLEAPHKVETPSISLSLLDNKHDTVQL